MFIKSSSYFFKSLLSFRMLILNSLNIMIGQFFRPNLSILQNYCSVAFSGQFLSPSANFLSTFRRYETGHMNLSIVWSQWLFSKCWNSFTMPSEDGHGTGMLFFMLILVQICVVFFSQISPFWLDTIWHKNDTKIDLVNAAALNDLPTKPQKIHLDMVKIAIQIIQIAKAWLPPWGLHSAPSTINMSTGSGESRWCRESEEKIEHEIQSTGKSRTPTAIN